MSGSLLAPWRLTFSRPITTGRSPGIVGVQEFKTTDYTVYADSVPGTIQFDRFGDRPLGGLPGDTRSRGVWKIIVMAMFSNPYRLAAQDAVQERDLIVDNTGRRFQVTAPEWSLLGWSISAELLIA